MQPVLSEPDLKHRTNCLHYNITLIFKIEKVAIYPHFIVFIHQDQLEAWKIGVARR